MGDRIARDHPSHTVASVSFSVLTQEELRKVSVVALTNPDGFDNLGHPIRGGVYDPALGPLERDDLCATCTRSYMTCDGHFGHIELPLPVFNPTFIRDFYKLLRGCCLMCHNLIAPKDVVDLLYHQLEVLEYGLVSTAEEMGGLAISFEDEKQYNTMCLQELPQYKKVRSSLREMEIVPLQKRLQTCQDKAIKDPHQLLQNPHSVEAEDFRQRILQNFIREYMMKRSKGNCFHCHIPKVSIKLVLGKSIVVGDVRNTSRPSKQHNTIGRDEATDDVDEEDELENVAELVSKNSGLSILSAKEAKDHLKLVWEKNKGILKYLFRTLIHSTCTRNPMELFFLDSVAVPPNRFRPIRHAGDDKFNHPQTHLLSKVIQSCNIIKALINRIKDDTIKLPESIIVALNRIPGMKDPQKLQNAWNNVQYNVNMIIDSELEGKNNINNVGVGIKQLLEKKEGLIRKHMMGKRVNYAARSVISPDPLIGIDEIGVPEIFAKKLVYPVPVTPWNVAELRTLVNNGPDVYPGASLVRLENGTLIRLVPNNRTQREAQGKLLLTPSYDPDNLMGSKTVYRHLLNGDMLLVNRQPTLHKPSIMAHKARILPKEKTIRLHYSNCKTYNADFDGDEMNIHVPQSEAARAEAYTIANVSNQYLVPKDGSPLGGLIQDHIVSGVNTIMRGQFYSWEDYQMLVCAGLEGTYGPYLTVPPAIIKPRQLWSGKQLISTLLINIIPVQKSLINMVGENKVSAKHWQKEQPRTWNGGGSHRAKHIMCESQLVIREGELLCGVMDKAQCGASAYSLVHCCYEIYGGNVATKLLTAFGRLFTSSLQMRGFTFGMEDCVTKDRADKKRRKLMRKGRKVGTKVAIEALMVPKADTMEMLKKKLKEAHYSKDDMLMKDLDLYMKTATDDICNNINTVMMAEGVWKQFPDNNLQVMVQSGAKGSTVNTMQIFGLVGQTELEGRRPPLMTSGKSLPVFAAYDVNPICGGFIDGRYQTGIGRAEEFFHCMAGREGLVDTAVKTSRIGYLQRCLIKLLEGVTVTYDSSVRDSDGTLYQTLYGEDGLDIQKLQFLNEKQLPFLADNYAAILDEGEIQKLMECSDTKKISKLRAKISKWKRKNMKEKAARSWISPFLRFSEEVQTNVKEDLCQGWYQLSDKDKKRYTKKVERAHCPDPILSKFRPDVNFGAISESLDELIENYATSNFVDDEENNERLYANLFRNIMYQKAIRSVCDPGEPVGLLAAQSIGEPSTQMTLNTFHYAGRGETNVTLGIPRLREILMVASANIATPSMEIPLLYVSPEKAEELRLKLALVHLNDVLERAEVVEKAKGYCRIHLKLLPHETYRNRFCVTPSTVLKYIETSFFLRLIKAMDRQFNIMKKSNMFGAFKGLEKQKTATKEEEGDGWDNGNDQQNENVANGNDAESSDEELGEDMAGLQFASKANQEQEYGEPEDEELFPDNASDEGFNEDAHGESPPLADNGEEDEDYCVVAAKKSMKRKSLTKLKKERERRINFVLGTNPCIQEYDYDMEEEKWCEVLFKLPTEGNILPVCMQTLLLAEAGKAVVHQVPNIKRAFISKSNTLITEGVNIPEMFKFHKILDMKKLYSNDIHAVAKTYGIEAAYKVIEKETQNVFKAYGITVDGRHISLIADRMTVNGIFEPFNRKSMEKKKNSSLQQMSFETTMHFLKSATLSGMEDALTSPSSCLVVGKPVRLGTGCFDVRVK